MGTESGDEPVDIDLAARLLRRALWNKVGLDVACAPVAGEHVAVAMTAAEATVLTTYLRETERRPF